MNSGPFSRTPGSFKMTPGSRSTVFSPSWPRIVLEGVVGSSGRRELVLVRRCFLLLGRVVCLRCGPLAVVALEGVRSQRCVGHTQVVSSRHSSASAPKKK